MCGWIAWHRDIRNHWLWDFKNADKYMAWSDLVMMANHEKKKFVLNGVLVECERGELAYSQLSLSTRWHWSRNKVRGFLEMLKNDGMIEQRSNTVTTIITICNYSKFQDINSMEGTTQGTTQGTTMVQRKDSARTAQGTQRTTNNNYNNENNENNKDIGAVAPIGKKPKTQKFEIPTISEIKQHIDILGYSVNPEAFHAYYSSNGWMVGKNKMKCWKAALVTWNKRANETHPGGTMQKKGNQANWNDQNTSFFDAMNSQEF